MTPAGWAPLDQTGVPGPEANASFAFDPTDGSDVLFGGFRAGSYLGNTWELKGAAWNLVPAASGPVARSSAAITYDGADGYVLLFGGTDGGYLGDTWEFRNGAWTELLAPAHGPNDGSLACDVYSGGVNTSTLAPCPSPRYGASMAFDPAGGHVVLFGGYNGTPLGDTWVFQGGAWMRGPPNPGPAPRYDAAMAYDLADGYLVLFGGQGSTMLLGDTWEFRGNWTQLTPSPAPSPRADAAMTFVDANGSLLLFGGRGPEPLGDSWEFRDGAWTNLATVPAPAPMWGSVLTYDEASGIALLWGGQNATAYFSEPWGFKTSPSNGWEDLSATLPVGYQGAEAYDEADGYLVAFGGFNGVYGQSTWISKAGAWIELEAPANGPNTQSTLCYAYRGGVNSSVPVTCPPPREGAAMTYDEKDGSVLLFGGTNANYLGDSWVFKAGSWTALQYADVGSTCWTNPPTDTTTGPCPDPRVSPSMSYDPEIGAVVLFGGHDASGFRNDTWTFAKGNWTEIGPLGHAPGLRDASGLSYDAADGYLLLFGGFGCPNPACNLYYELNDTWEFRSGTWTNLTAAAGPAPSVRQAPGMDYDATDGYVVLFGGQGCQNPPSCTQISSLSDTWAYRHGSWTKQPLATIPEGRYAAVLTYDPAEGYALLSAGYNITSTLSDVWAYANPLSIVSLTASPSILDVGETSHLATDVAGGLIPYSFSYGVPAGCTSANASTLPCPPSSAGNDPITVTVTDRSGYTLQSSTLIYVYDLPVITGLRASRSSSDVGQAVTFTATPSGSSNPTETFAWTAPPGLGCASSTGASLACVPTTVGNDSVEVNMTDPSGATSPTVAYASYPVHPAPATTVPVVTPAHVDVGENVTISATLLSAGNGSDTYSWNGLPSGCAALDALTLGPCPVRYAGNYSISVTVTDSNHYSTENGSAMLSVEPDPVAYPPVANRTSVDVGQRVIFNSTAEGGTGVLNYTWTGTPSTLGCATTTSRSLACDPNLPGNYTVAVRVTDTLGVSSPAVSLGFVVYALPTLNPLVPSRTVLDAQETVTFRSTLTSPGSGSVTYRLSPSSADLSCSVGGAGGSCTALHPGNYTASLVARDSNGGVANVTSPSLRVLTDPTISAPTFSRNNLTFGASVSVLVVVAGGTGNYTLTWYGLPSGCASTLTSFTCTPTAAGTFSVTVSAVDSTGFNVTSPQATLTITGISPSYGDSTGDAALILFLIAISTVIVVVIVMELGWRVDRGPIQTSKRKGKVR